PMGLRIDDEKHPPRKRHVAPGTGAPGVDEERRAQEAEETRSGQAQLDHHLQRHVVRAALDGVAGELRKVAPELSDADAHEAVLNERYQPIIPEQIPPARDAACIARLHLIGSRLKSDRRRAWIADVPND